MDKDIFPETDTRHGHPQSIPPCIAGLNLGDPNGRRSVLDLLSDGDLIGSQGVRSDEHAIRPLSLPDAKPAASNARKQSSHSAPCVFMAILVLWKIKIRSIMAVE